MVLRVLVAPNAFKECLSASSICKVLQRGVLNAVPNAKVFSVPLADGGDGTLEVLVENEGENGQIVQVGARDPLGRNVQSQYGLINSGKTAIIEMAQVSGLWMLKEEEKNPLWTHTFGTGQLMNSAVENGVSKILMCIGGSATNDGAMGLVNALGVDFYDKNRNILPPCGNNLKYIHDYEVKDKNLFNRIQEIDIEVACDVTNPLLGPLGATRIYGPQKGASTEDIMCNLENGLKNLSQICKNKMGEDYSTVSGAGAAGGLGFGLMSFCGAKLVPGFDLVARQSNLLHYIQQSDLVITGEGEINESTAHGKVPMEISKLCHENNVPCVSLVGAITGTPPDPIIAFSIQNRPMTLQTSIDDSEILLELGAEQITKLFAKSYSTASKL